MKYVLMVMLTSVWLNATCIQMLDEKDIIKGNLKVSYCDGDMIKIWLKNKNQFLTDYSKLITLVEFGKLVDGYKKASEWHDKAKEMKVDITKNIVIIPNNLTLGFMSGNKSALILTVLSGANNKATTGSFGVARKDNLIEIISKLEYIKNNGKAKFKKQADAFN